MLRYRIYIDESGDPTLSQVHNPDYRYLGLTGTAIEQQYYRTTFHHDLESLKQEHFPHNPDEPIILLRKAIMSRIWPFHKLQDPDKNAMWEKGLLEFLNKAQMVLFTVVIDKKDHLAQYGQAAFHPYHYCMQVLLERLRGFLRSYGGIADIMAEARGWRNEDKRLQQAYENMWCVGTYYIPGQEFQKVFTSKEIKFRTKSHNIAGLQATDLIAAPAKLAILADNNIILPAALGRFTVRINQEILRKYNPWGRVFLH